MSREHTAELLDFLLQQFCAVLSVLPFCSVILFYFLIIPDVTRIPGAQNVVQCWVRCTSVWVTAGVG